MVQHADIDHTGITGVGGSLTGGNVEMGADVTMTNANTDYDGPSQSLAAGTYLILWKVLFQQVGSTRPTYRGKLWNGTTIYDEQENSADTTAAYRYDMTGFAVVVLGSTTTVKISVQSDLAAQVLKRNGGASVSHRPTSMSYVKIA